MRSELDLFGILINLQIESMQIKNGYISVANDFHSKKQPYRRNGFNRIAVSSIFSGKFIQIHTFSTKKIDKSANKLSDFSDLEITTKIMLLQSRASVNIFPFFDMNDQRIRVMN